MKTPLQEIIQLFEKGANIHKEAMENKSASTISKNRDSYLYQHCLSVVAIASEILQKEKQIIEDAVCHGRGNKNDITIEIAKEYYKETFKSEQDGDNKRNKS